MRVLARKQDILKYRIFVGDRLLESLSEEEQKEFQQRTVQRMGNALNRYFSQHIEEYKKLEGISTE